MIVELLKKLKKERADENLRLARSELTSFLDGKASDLKEELEFLASYVLSENREATWISGPIKKIEKAMSKTIADYDYAFGENKDLIRGTLACKTHEEMNVVAVFLTTKCRNPTCGLSLVKDVYQKSVRDGGQVKTGYSGWNFVIEFDEYPFGAEVQVNTIDMLYGKHGKADIADWLRIGDAGYAALQNRLKFPGGLGHAMYDIQDTARSNAGDREAEWARELSLDYNDACRGEFRGPSSKSVDQLNDRIRRGWGRLTPNGIADKLWGKALEESGWTGFPLAKTRAEWEHEYEVNNLARNKERMRQM